MACYSDYTIISMTLKYKNSLSLAFLYFKYTLRFAITCFVRLQYAPYSFHLYKTAMHVGQGEEKDEGFA